MTAFGSTDGMGTLRNRMSLGSAVTKFTGFFAHVKMFAKNKPTDGTTYGITAKGFSSMTSLPSCYNNSQNGWTYNAIAASHKRLSKFIGYDHAVSGPVSGPTVSVDSTDNSSSGSFSYSIQLYAGTSARISLADIIGTSAKLGVYCVGASDGATHSVAATTTIGSSGTVSVSVSVSGWTAQTYYIYPYLLVGSTYYTIPTITRSQVSVTQYVAPAPSVDGIVITGYSGAVQVGQSFTLHVYEHMSDGTTRDEVTFANMWSGYTSIASISGTGTFTGTAAGTATLKATYMGYEATLPITIEAVPVTLQSITLNRSTLSLTAGGSTSTLIATAHYSDGTTQQLTSSAVTWQIESGSSYASVDSSGKVTPVAEGTAVVKATYQGCVARCTVTVAAAPSQDIAITQAKIYYSNADYSGDIIEITPQQAISLTAVCAPSNATIASYSWASSAPAKARVTGATSATCTVIGRAGSSATITLTVTDTQGNIKTRTVTIKVDEGAM